MICTSSTFVKVLKRITKKIKRSVKWQNWKKFHNKRRKSFCKREPKNSVPRHMEWVSHCLWKLNLFVNCWKVRQKWKVTQEATLKCVVNKCLAASNPYLFGNGCPASEAPSPHPLHLLGYGRATGGDSTSGTYWPITVVLLRDWTWDTGECDLSLGQWTQVWNSGSVELRDRRRWSGTKTGEHSVARVMGTGSGFNCCLTY